MEHCATLNEFIKLKEDMINYKCSFSIKQKRSFDKDSKKHKAKDVERCSFLFTIASAT